MNKDPFDFSFDEIVSEQGDENEIREERLIEIKRYEKMYLLKPQPNYDLSLSDISDDERSALFNQVVFSGFRRNYIEDLSERDYALENCTPYQVKVGSSILEDGSWGDLLCKLVECLLDMKPEKREHIEDFRTPWTKTAMFATSRKTNYKQIDESLYLNCNHTALHSCWLLQDLLDYFEIDKKDVTLLIHRPCSAERKELREYLQNEFQRGFKKYICACYEKPLDYADKVIRTIEKYLNPLLSSVSKSYPNFFLFDDAVIASGYVKKIKEVIDKSAQFEPKAKKVLNKYLNYLLAFYKL